MGIPPQSGRFISPRSLVMQTVVSQLQRHLQAQQYMCHVGFTDVCFAHELIESPVSINIQQNEVIATDLNVSVWAELALLGKAHTIVGTQAAHIQTGLSHGEYLHSVIYSFLQTTHIPCQSTIPVILFYLLTIQVLTV